MASAQQNPGGEALRCPPRGPNSAGQIEPSAAPNQQHAASDPIEAILEVLRKGERFLVCSHSRPDGDAVGSVLAMGMLLRQMGKRADLVTADRVPSIYRG